MKKNFSHRPGTHKIPRCLILTAVATAGMTLGIAPAFATLSCTGSGKSPGNKTHTIAGAADFTLSGNHLTLVLKNTTSGGTLDQGDALTGVIFN
jgi:hypothetical protein